MYLGRIVEEAPTDALFAHPKHPYTEALLKSVLTPEPGRGIPDTNLGAAYPNPLDVPPGCSFHPRCGYKMPDCSVRAPRRSLVGQAAVECHLHDNAGAATDAPAREVVLS